HSLTTPTPTPEPYTLSLHDALPISRRPAGAAHLVRRHRRHRRHRGARPLARLGLCRDQGGLSPLLSFRGEGRGEGLVASRSSPADRKSTRLNSSHVEISYAVFCLKK